MARAADGPRLRKGAMAPRRGFSRARATRWRAHSSSGSPEESRPPPPKLATPHPFRNDAAHRMDRLVSSRLRRYHSLGLHRWLIDWSDGHPYRGTASANNAGSQEPGHGSGDGRPSALAQFALQVSAPSEGPSWEARYRLHVPAQSDLRSRVLLARPRLPEGASAEISPRLLEAQAQRKLRTG